MKVYVLIKDETEYNGDRTVHGVYPTYDDAKSAGDWETEKAQDWVDSMRETSNDGISNWVPEFYIEETEFYCG